MLAAGVYRVHSLDVLRANGDSTPRRIADTIGQVDAAFERITDREAVRPLLAALPPRERSVQLRFFESMTEVRSPSASVSRRCRSRASWTGRCATCANRCSRTATSTSPQRGSFTG